MITRTDLPSDGGLGLDLGGHIPFVGNQATDVLVALHNMDTMTIKQNTGARRGHINQGLRNRPRGGQPCGDENCSLRWAKIKSKATHPRVVLYYISNGQNVHDQLFQSRGIKRDGNVVYVNLLFHVSVQPVYLEELGLMTLVCSQRFQSWNNSELMKVSAILRIEGAAIKTKRRSASEDPGREPLIRGMISVQPSVRYHAC